MTNGRKSDSASSEAITDETGSTSSKKEKKRRNSFKRAFAGCFKPTPSETGTYLSKVGGSPPLCLLAYSMPVPTSFLCPANR